MQTMFHLAYMGWVAVHFHQYLIGLSKRIALVTKSESKTSPIVCNMLLQGHGYVVVKASILAPVDPWFNRFILAESIWMHLFV